MRSFIGIDFSEELKDQIFSLQKTLKQYTTSGRWKNRDNFHLTLKFLGEIDKEAIERIDWGMKDIAGSTSSFSLNISKAGVFPGKNIVRVLWLGLDGELNKLYSLQKTVDTKLEACGFEAESRPYSPHVTIAQDLVFTSGFDEIQKQVGRLQFPQIHVNTIYLFKSEQVGAKRVYTHFREYAFCKRHP